MLIHAAVRVANRSDMRATTTTTLQQLLCVFVCVLAVFSVRLSACKRDYGLHNGN